MIIFFSPTSNHKNPTTKPNIHTANWNWNTPLSPWTTTNSKNSQYLNPLKIHKTKTQTHKKFTIPKPTMAQIKFGSCPTFTTTTTTRLAIQNYEHRERGMNEWWEKKERMIDLTVDGQNQFKQKNWRREKRWITKAKRREKERKNNKPCELKKRERERKKRRMVVGFSFEEFKSLRLKFHVDFFPLHLCHLIELESKKLEMLVS